MRTGVAALIVLVAVALVPSAAAAQLPVGEADGVRIVRESGRIVVVFTPRAAQLYRRLAGRFVGVECHELIDPDGGPFQSVGSGYTVFRAPRQGRRLRTGDHARWDYCRVWLEARTVRRNGRRERRPRALIVSIPLTQRGAIRLDEQAKASVLLKLEVAVGIIAYRLGLKTFPTPPQVLARTRSPRVVALPTADATPPAGSVGYYSDGQQRAALVILSASGRRLFIGYEGDGVVRTNVAPYIYGKLD